MAPIQHESYEHSKECPDWPDDFKKKYIQSGFWRDETLSCALAQRALEFPQNIALVDGNTRYTFQQLNERVERLAAGFASLGFASADRVVVQMINSASFVEVTFALFRIGAWPIFALPAHRALEISRFAQFAEAKGYIISDSDGLFDYKTLAREIISSSPSIANIVVAGVADEFISLGALYHDPISIDGPQAHDVACLQLSGGTSGIPKLIPRRHDEYLYFARAAAEVCGVDSSSAYLCTLPMSHNMPMAGPGFVGTLCAGGKIVITQLPSPDECFPLIERERVTITALVPPLAILWLEAASTASEDLSSLKTLEVGGAKLSPEIARRIRPVLNCTLVQGFGFTEGQAYMTRLDDPEHVITETQGRPISPGDEFRIVDEDDRDVPPGDLGELLARGPYTVRGYYRMPDHNKVAFTEDGFYRSGDIVRLTPTGNVVVEGRSKEQINKGGEKFSPEEVENLCLAHVSVFDAAIVSMPDAIVGERTTAFIIRRSEELRREDLVAFLRGRGLAPYKLPDRIEFVPSFPETAVGKTSRRALRDTLRATYLTQPVIVKGAPQ